MLHWNMKRKIEKVINKAQEDVLTKQNAKVDLLGNAVIPQGIRRIAHGAFEGKTGLRCVVLPDSVKALSERAFANCVNLEQVQLNEGLKEIEGNVFNGCSKLKHVVFPDSLQDSCAYTFHGAAFESPIYNRSQSVLYHYPGNVSQKIVTLAGNVECLGAGAFFHHAAIEEVILPEGLEKIDTQAFLGTSLRRITIPSSVMKIESEAFWNCPELEEVNICCPLSALDANVFYKCPKVQFRMNGLTMDFEKELAIRGISLFDIPRRMKVPEGDFWKSECFLELAKRCAKGNAGAMLEFAQYFEHMGDQPFFQCTANFWYYRAFLYGDAQAEEWKRNWMKAHPRQRIPSVLPANLNWNIAGEQLRALGFLFFEPDREYSLEGVDENGIVLVSSWCDSDGPDEDGFGREEYYDWWYLDDCLYPIPGVRKIGCCSQRDRRLLVKGWFDAAYTQSVKALQHK